jgi:hypothetical protein
LTPSGKGTAFSMDIDGRQYLITAKHVVEGFGGEAYGDSIRYCMWSRNCAGDEKYVQGIAEFGDFFFVL